MLLVNLSLIQAVPKENALNQKCELVQYNLPVYGVTILERQLNFLKLKDTKP